MTIPFFKYHGAGNDFIILNEFENAYLKFIPDPTLLIAQLCNRRYGIGADGLMILRKSQEYDFEMIYYNSDGKQGSMCGNGGRCIVAYAFHEGIIGKSTKFIAVDGLHEAIINSDKDFKANVSLKMSDVSKIEKFGNDYVLDTGSPHYIKFTEKIDTLDVNHEGRQIRNSKDFKKTGINVNFAQKQDKLLKIRTYERGVEEETLACGTGITALAIAAHHSSDNKNLTDYVIEARGGILQVTFDFEENKKYYNIILTGPAQKVFDGVINPEIAFAKDD